MGGRTSQFIRAASGVAKMLPFPLLMRLSGQKVLVLLYHAVTDQPPAHLRHLYRIKTAAEFSSDLDYLLRRLQPIDVHALRDHISGAKSLQKPSFLITFDDGLREFGEVAAPLLRQKGVPAICFLNTGFVGNEGLFFRYQASLLQDHLLGREDDAAVKSWLTKQEGGGKTLRETLMGVRYHERDTLEALARGVGLDFGAYLRQERPYLDHEEVKSLQQEGFDFGAHSEDHPEYQYLPLEEQLRQTRASQDAVQLRWGVGERWFAFPFTDFGVSRSFFDQLYADSPPPQLTFGCAGLKKDHLPRHVQRIPLESAGDRVAGRGAQDILPAELLYYLLKAPLGKNKIRRS